MTKSEARAAARARWRQWDAGALQALGARMAAELFGRAEWRQAGTVFCFVPMPGEPDLWPVLQAAPAAGKRLLVPRVRGGEMELVALHSLDDLAPGAYGIREPVRGEVVPPDALPAGTLALIPCLAVGADGVRLGRGGGYYDRFLAQYKGKRLLVCPPELRLTDIPADAWDARFAPDEILTGVPGPML